MIIRAMTLADLALVLDWAAAEGWNPGIDDAAAFFAADPEGFFVAEMAGQPVAAICVVNHSGDYAFLGLYLCHPDWRGQGIGFALWTHALIHAGGRTVGLDGVAAQEANYAKSGFARSGSTMRLQGRVTQGDPSGIRRVIPADHARLVALDRIANGVTRARFLAAWLAPSATRATVVMDDGAGWATARLCREGCKIGPVIAPDAATALRLIAAAADTVRASAVIVDIPEANTALITALRDLRFIETFRTARMYRGKAPVSAALLQAVATLELG